MHAHTSSNLCTPPVSSLWIWFVHSTLWESRFKFKTKPSVLKSPLNRGRDVVDEVVGSGGRERMSLSVCLRPLFLDNHWSDLIETCQEYCWGPVDVPFQGSILIGQVVPKLWPFIYQTNDRTRCYDVTIDVTSVLCFLHVRPRTYGHARTGTRERRNGLCGCFWHAVWDFCLFVFCTYGPALV